MIKLVAQCVVRYLNQVIDTINGAAKLTTERILAILEDLNKFQEALAVRVKPKILEMVPEGAEHVDLLFSEFDRRVDLMMRPCIEAISKKV